MSTEPSSLTPDERALAERLARVGPHAEPSPALDARVLAAAREAVTVPPRRHRRWPAMLGLAASLVLAVGVAWRLRPVPEGVPEGRVSTSAAQTATVSAARDVAAQPSAANTSPDTADAIDSVMVQKAQAPQPKAASVARPPPPAADAAPAASIPQAKVARGNSAATSDVAAAPPQPGSAPIESPPPPPPAPPAPAAERAAPQAFQRAAPPAPSEPVAPPQAFGDEAQRAASASRDEPSIEVPPATADTPAVRDAWLQRIQALVDEGDINAAKASLRAFVQRYPDYTLPENLRALAR